METKNEEVREQAKFTIPYYKSPKTEGIFVQFGMSDFAAVRVITLIEALLMEKALPSSDNIDDATKLMASLRKGLKDAFIQKNRAGAPNAKAIVFLNIPFDQLALLWGMLKIALEDNIIDDTQRRLLYMDVFSEIAKDLDKVIVDISKIPV